MKKRFCNESAEIPPLPSLRCAHAVDEETITDPRGPRRTQTRRWSGGKIGYRDLVTSLEVILVMTGVPLAIMVLLGLLTLRPRFARPRRYRAHEERSHPPVLFTADPEALRGGLANHRTTGSVRGGHRGDG